MPEPSKGTLMEEYDKRPLDFAHNLARQVLLRDGFYFASLISSASWRP